MRHDPATPTWLNAGRLVLSASVVIIAITAVVWLGRTRWRVLHVAGSYYIWLIFMIAFGKRALRHPASFYSIAIIALILALTVRLMTVQRRNMSNRRILSG